jgi:hypothetical protein
MDGELIRSVYYDQSEILRGIMLLYCPDGFDVDASYGHGKFYVSIPRPKRCFDIDPQFDFVERFSSINLPFENSSVSSIVFDPPFLTYIKDGRNHSDGKAVMSKRFGGYYTYGQLEEHYKSSLIEFNRILVKNGKLIFKCQDIIHNHKMHCTHHNLINWAEKEGFSLLDLFILSAKHRMPSPQKGKQRHARIFHSYFLVFTKKNSVP